MEVSSSHPPTPPADVDREIDTALEFLNSSFPDSPSDSRVKDPLNTIATQTPPPSSPTPSDTGPALVAEPPLKKIRFSPYTHEITHSDEQVEVYSPSEGRSPAEGPRTRPSATKSILKRPAQNEVHLTAGSDGHASFPVVLDSAVRQLQNDDRSSRLDAYLVLSGTLRVSQGRLNPSLLLDKVAFFEHCLRRDLKARSEESGALDINLVTQALKLTALLFRIPQLFFSFSRDFLTESMAQTIESLTQTGISKALVTSRLMFLVHTPLVSRVSNSEQLNCLISALSDLHRRVSGNNILILRLLMYRMLLYEESDLMLDRVNSWLPLLIKGMLSASSETRNRAIDCATYAGKKIGSQPPAAKALQHLLARDVKGQTLFSILEQHLCDLLNRRVDAIQVPRIWSSLVLFFRSKQSSLSNWCYITPWMKIIQRCFNSSDKAVSIQAYDSWKKLIFSVGLDQNTRPSMIKALRQPISSRLCLRAKDKDSRLLWEAAFSSYCTLLRHSFPQQASAEQIQMFWDNFVAQVFTDTTLYHQDHAEKACLVLMALFGDNEPLLQYLGALSESDYSSDLEAIASISPRWVRRHLPSVLHVVEIVMYRAPWSSDGAVGGSMLSVWSSLMKTISDAGAKEVKTSKELKDAISTILGFLKSLWSKGPSFESTPREDLTGFRDTCSLLARSALDHLGPINFAGQYLSLQADGKVIHDLHPSDESHHDTLQSAIHIIASIFSQDRWNGQWELKEPSEAANLLSLCLDGLASYKGASPSINSTTILQQVTEETKDRPLLQDKVWKHLAALTNASSQTSDCGQWSYEPATGGPSAYPLESPLDALVQFREQESGLSGSSRTANESNGHNNDKIGQLTLPHLRRAETTVAVDPTPTFGPTDSPITFAHDTTVAARCSPTFEKASSSHEQTDCDNDIYDAFIITDLAGSAIGDGRAVDTHCSSDDALEMLGSTHAESGPPFDNISNTRPITTPDPSSDPDLQQRSRSRSASLPESDSPCSVADPSAEGHGNGSSDMSGKHMHKTAAGRLPDVRILERNSAEPLSICEVSTSENRVFEEMQDPAGSSFGKSSQDHQYTTIPAPRDYGVQELDEDTIRVAMTPAPAPMVVNRAQSIHPKRGRRKARSVTPATLSGVAGPMVKTEESLRLGDRLLKRASETLSGGQVAKRRPLKRQRISQSTEELPEIQQGLGLPQHDNHLIQDSDRHTEIHSSSSVPNSQRRRSARLSGVRESSEAVTRHTRRPPKPIQKSTVACDDGNIASTAPPRGHLSITPPLIEDSIGSDQSQCGGIYVLADTDVPQREDNQREETVGVAATGSAVTAAAELTYGPEMVTAEVILQQLRGVLTNCKAVIFGPQQVQEVDDIQWTIMNIQKEVLEGKRRSGGQSTLVVT